MRLLACAEVRIVVVVVVVVVVLVLGFLLLSVFLQNKDFGCVLWRGFFFPFGLG